MAKSDLTIPSNFPEGFENHNWKNSNTNFDELYARITALETKIATLENLATKVPTNAGNAGVVTVIGSNTTPTQSVNFVVGGGGGNTSTTPVTVTNQDGTTRSAVEGVDFYWDGLTPIFYKDLTVLRTVEEYERDNPKMRGWYVTYYDNGHTQREEIPMSVWNPALNSYNQLSVPERREVLDKYQKETGTAFMVSPGEYEWAECYEGQSFRSFLERQGFGS
jgi:hypothetical protein